MGERQKGREDGGARCNANIIIDLVQKFSSILSTQFSSSLIFT